MKQFELAYVPIGVPTFHLESARKEFDKSAALLRSLDPDAAVIEAEGEVLVVCSRQPARRASESRAGRDDGAHRPAAGADVHRALDGFGASL